MIKKSRKTFFQRERLSRRFFTPRWIWQEHLARYSFAVPYLAGRYVVDCACGEGIGSKLLSESGAKQVESYDLSPEAIAQAKACCSAKNMRFHVAEASRLPLPKACVDVFLSFETIEHIDQDGSFLQEVVRCMKPDGIFLCSTPNRDVSNPGKTLRDKPQNRFHVREYNKKEFVKLLQTTFKTVELYGQNPRHDLKTWLLQLSEKVLPRYGTLGLHLLLKIPRFIFCRSTHGKVQKIRQDRDYEYCVAVCRAPRQDR